ncbi:MAG TPA: protein kinase [Kofleriaceae bacterium]|nr:protein kinase [Kofleriaceae bacterium]
MGERLGRYTVLKHLASGGMADVLLGRTDGIEGFERHVVLKRIRAEHAKDQRFISMFLDEARTAANLHHQNIVQVYDIGESSGEFFFAMEYIHGEDLRKLLSAVSKSKTHMPLGYVVAIVSAAASGLHYAHDRKGPDKKPMNIVHRDVSPSNILIGYDGAVKVVDFGIAKAATRAVETRSGSLKGKVSYMSPEQCKGEDIDRRSDVYALGVLLYELSTTTRLFKGDNDYLLMDAIVNGKVPLPRVRRPDLPNELSSIIMRALSVDPNRRYQTAEELRIGLDQFAIKANLTCSTSALATYMNKMFGERPEPWLDAGSTSVDHKPAIDVEGPTAAGESKPSVHHSWTEIPRDAIDDETDEAKTTTGGGGDGDNQKTRTDGKGKSGRVSSRRSSVNNAVALQDTIAPPISTKETRTSMKMGWEAQGARPTAPASRAKWAVALVPMLALVGFAAWHYLNKEPEQKPAAQPVAQTMNAPSAAGAPTAPPTGEVAQPQPAAAQPAAAQPAAQPVADEPPALRVVGVEDDTKTAPVTPTPAAKQGSTHVVQRKTVPATKAVTPPPTQKTTTTATPAPTTTAPAAPVTPPPVTPPPVTPPPQQPAVAAPAAPQVVEAPQMAVLSNATVSGVASDHSRELGKCEGGAELHGDVAVSFQIDAGGKVVKSQLSSSIKNPKVSACILKSVQGWKFPKPPSGAAKGVYSISYQ